MKTLLAGLISLVTLYWAWDVLVTGGASGGSAPWVMRQEGLHLSGLLSITLMSLAMLLAARPAWLEWPLGGLDQMDQTRKWAGILGVGITALHWLIEMSDNILKPLFGREGRPKYAGLLEMEQLRDLGVLLGELAICAVLVILALTLWKHLPSRPWRLLHRSVPALYLMLAFHALLLTPIDYWAKPVGWLLALLLAGGVYGSVHSMAGSYIGRSRRGEADTGIVPDSSPSSPST